MFKKKLQENEMIFKQDVLLRQKVQIIRQFTLE